MNDAYQASLTSSRLKVRCPSCGDNHLYSLDNPYRPFCSKGCKAIDLGAWASEHYRMEANIKSEDQDSEPSA